MPIGLRLMSVIGVVIGFAGLPVLLRPAWVRATFRLRATPQSDYVLRVLGAMLASLGLILIIFAAVYWKASA